MSSAQATAAAWLVAGKGASAPMLVTLLRRIVGWFPNARIAVVGLGMRGFLIE
jgi:hypothetical protein